MQESKLFQTKKRNETVVSNRNPSFVHRVVLLFVFFLVEIQVWTGEARDIVGGHVH